LVASLVDCRERLFFKIACYVSSEILNTGQPQVGICVCTW